MREFALLSTTALFVTLFAQFGCDAGDSSNDGQGGASATGGGKSTGGASATGGVKSTGGTSATGGSSASTGGSTNPNCSSSGAWETTETYGSARFGKYMLRNNMWNSTKAGVGTQKLWAQDNRCWGVTASHTDSGEKGTVKSYPDIVRGWAIGAAGYQTSDHGLGIQVSQLKKATIRWSMQAPTTGRTWALWDIYFHENTSPGSGTAPVNLMIQQRIVDSDGWMQQDSNGWGKVTIAGYSFREKLEPGSTFSATRNRVQLYVDKQSGSVLGADDMKLDLKAVIDYYVGKGAIKSTDYLTSIQAGWEIVSGGTYQTNDFWTAVQDEPEPN